MTGLIPIFKFVSSILTIRFILLKSISSFPQNSYIERSTGPTRYLVLTSNGFEQPFRFMSHKNEKLDPNLIKGMINVDYTYGIDLGQPIRRNIDLTFGEDIATKLRVKKSLIELQNNIVKNCQRSSMKSHQKRSPPTHNQSGETNGIEYQQSRLSDHNDTISSIFPWSAPTTKTPSGTNNNNNNNIRSIVNRMLDRTQVEQLPNEDDGDDYNIIKLMDLRKSFLKHVNRPSPNVRQCRVKKLEYQAIKTDEFGNTCSSMIKMKVCAGGCLTEESGDWRIPYIKSKHDTCNFEGLKQRHIRLEHCSSDIIDDSLRDYYIVEPENCTCKACDHKSSHCLTTTGNFPIIDSDAIRY